MKNIVNSFVIGILLTIPTLADCQINLNYNGNNTPTYDEVIAMYRYLDDQFSTAKLIEAGPTDSGKPLHLFIISKHGLFTPEKIKKENLSIIFINNGIHPGESNGIDASLEFANELLYGNNRNTKYLENSVIVMVPVFNIGGALNRSAYHRANQNGPTLHGFRGNSRNLDLNRDFVKMDSRNTRSLVQLIQAWDPDIFLDTHSTNGADYPYTVTLVLSHHQQLEQPQSQFFHEKMIPEIMKSMNESPYKTTHYVNVFRESPEKGFEGFIQYPRYLCGYTTNFHMLSFTIETHMLKPYEERVLSTKYLFEEILEYVALNAQEIKNIKNEAINITAKRTHYTMQWEIDREKFDPITFQGYKAKKRMSDLTGLEMMYYDRNERWTVEIPFYNYFNPASTIKAPKYYIIPSAWKEVTDRLKICNIFFEKLKNDTSLAVETYYIKEFETLPVPYNGHYYHNSVHTRKIDDTIQFYAGDIIIPVNQRGNSYIVQTLEPTSFDSFFRWNFFDEILSRKEYYSPYLFENTALEFLNKNPDIKLQFEKKRASEPEFKSDHYSQLQWIYEHSPWSELTYMRYPVFRYQEDF